MKSPTATPEEGVSETEKNAQEEIWEFIAATFRRGLKRLLEDLLEEELTTRVKARKYERTAGRRGHRGGII